MSVLGREPAELLGAVVTSSRSRASSEGGGEPAEAVPTSGPRAADGPADPGHCAAERWTRRPLGADLSLHDPSCPGAGADRLCGQKDEFSNR